MEPFQRLQPAAGWLFHHSEEAGNRNSVGARHEKTSKPAGTLAHHYDCMATRQRSAWKFCWSACALTSRLLVMLACFFAIMLHACTQGTQPVTLLADVLSCQAVRLLSCWLAY
jgi:hypothetical protein